jgi:hypothetical protein
MSLFAQKENLSAPPFWQKKKVKTKHTSPSSLSAVAARHTRDEGGARRHRRRSGPGCQDRAVQGTCRRLRAEHGRQRRRRLLKEMVTTLLAEKKSDFFGPQKIRKKILQHSSRNSRKTNLKAAFLLVYNSWILLDSTRVQAEIDALKLR